MAMPKSFARAGSSLSGCLALMLFLLTALASSSAQKLPPPGPCFYCPSALTFLGNSSVSGQFAALSRESGTVEAWWIAPDGSVDDAYWYQGHSWNKFQIAGTGSAAPQGGVAAVSRMFNTMEIFWIGLDGSVRDAYWYEGMQSWQSFPITAPGKASQSGRITAHSRIPASLEVFWVGADGSIHGAAWQDKVFNWTAFQVAPAGSAPLGTSISAYSYTGAGLEVFWVAADGSVRAAVYDDFTNRHNQPFAITTVAPAGSASTSAGISAFLPGGDVVGKAHVEVLWVAPDGSVRGIVSDRPDPSWFSSWQPIQLAPAGSASIYGGVTGSANNHVVNGTPMWAIAWWIGAQGSIEGAHHRLDSFAESRFQLWPAGFAAPISKISGVVKWDSAPYTEVFWNASQGSFWVSPQ